VVRGRLSSFGAAQQLVTRFIDSRSNELLAAVTSTDEHDIQPDNDSNHPVQAP
jgi:hypothetical protein